MIKIDVDTRCWKIPKEEAFIGVESDDKVKILQFELSKNEFCDGLNFTDCNCFINYKNEGNDTIPYLITDMEVQEDGTVTFTWEVSRGATIFKGNTFAILCAKKVSEDGTITNEWNSRIGSFTVSKGLEPSSSITEVHEIDIISQLLLLAQQANTNAKNNINKESLLLEKAEGLGYLKEDFDVLEARMNQFTSLQEGSTTGDAELIDGRIGYDGTVYDNIGGAIRNQVSKLKSDIANIGNPTDEQVSTAVNNYLDKNPVSGLDASTAQENQVPTADGQGNWSWQTQQSGTGSEETDPTVPNWAKQPNKPTYTASEVGALPDTTKIPSKTSDLQNDRGFLTEHQVNNLIDAKLTGVETLLGGGF